MKMRIAGIRAGILLPLRGLELGMMMPTLATKMREADGDDDNGRGGVDEQRYDNDDQCVRGICC